MLAIAVVAAAGGLCIANVHDGDSIRLCDGERVRIANIDAPEMPGSSRCDKGRGGWCDYRLAELSRDALRAFLATGDVTIVRLGKDRYGRTLARVRVNGQDVGTYLVRKGLARRWGR